MHHPARRPLRDLLPIRFEGGFVLADLSGQCPCGADLDVDQWAANVAWLPRATCVLTLDAVCIACSEHHERRLHVRGLPNRRGEVELHSEGQWRRYEVAGIGLYERVRALLG